MSHRILIVDDEPRFRDLYRRVLEDAGFEVVEAGDVAAARQALQTQSPSMVISDVRMPGPSGLNLLQDTRASGNELPFLLVTAFADVRDAVAALRLGAVDYLAKPVDLDELVTAVTDALGIEAAADTEVPPEALKDVVAESAVMRATVRDAWRIAQSDVNVLITGESGTGKEVMASFIHAHGARRGGPFVAVNCAAMPESLLSAELFGHDKGAFTGAVSARKGKFREAEGGTLFLDEIGDMPLSLQPVLLRALETKTVTPLGGSGEVRVDFRLIAATNSELEAAVADGRFRADLYYRLSVFAVHLEPLRDRQEDILPLARHFLRASSTPKRLTRAAGELMVRHPWPGNVRELHNAIQRARLIARGDTILPEDLPPSVRRASAPLPLPTSTSTSTATATATSTAVNAGSLVAVAADHDKDDDSDDDLGTRSTDDGHGDMTRLPTLKEGQEAAVRQALAATGGNRTRAAELLGMSRRGLLKKLKRLEIE